MSDVKVFANPEAYKLSTSVYNGETTKSAVEAAKKQKQKVEIYLFEFTDKILG